MLYYSSWPSLLLLLSQSKTLVRALALSVLKDGHQGANIQRLRREENLVNFNLWLGVSSSLAPRLPNSWPRGAGKVSLVSVCLSTAPMLNSLQLHCYTRNLPYKYLRLFTWKCKHTYEHPRYYLNGNSLTVSQRNYHNCLYWNYWLKEKPNHYLHGEDTHTVCLSVSVFLFNLSICLSVYLSVCLSVCL